MNYLPSFPDAQATASLRIRDGRPAGPREQEKRVVDTPRACGSPFGTSIRSHDYCGNARTRHLRRISRRKPAAAWGTHASRMHIMRSMQLACAQASPKTKAVLCLEPRASIGTRAYHPNTQEPKNMDAPTASGHRYTTSASLRWHGRVPFASCASLP